MIPYHLGIANWKDARRVLLRFPVLVGDLCAVSLGYVLAFLVRFNHSLFLEFFPVTKGFPSPHDYLSAAPVILFMWAAALLWLGCYKRIQMAALDDLVRLFRVSLMGTLLAMSAMFLYRSSSFSRLVFLIGGGFGYFFLYFYRQLIKIAYVSWVHSQNKHKRVLILGKGYLAKSLKKILHRKGDAAVFLSEDANDEKIKEYIIKSGIQEVLLAHPEISHAQTVSLAGFCEEKGVAFRLIPNILEIRMGELIIDESLGLPTFQIKPVSLQGSAFLTKRVMDVFLATFLIGLFFVPLAMIAILIKVTSPGPIFYKHSRVGFRGRPFFFMKFRTMVQEADDLLKDLKAKSDRKGPVFKMKQDPRITSIGKVLRRYSLDEVPQLINVLRGEMSIVGPRPQVLWEAKHYDDWARKRLNVLPGITGLWQVSGRAELTYEEMIDLDIFYIEHWSPGLDIKILLKTIPAVLSAKGAY